MNKTIVLKYGGNAMIDEKIKDQLINNICLLQGKGHQLVMVHGGGPYIAKALEKANVESEFIDGQRKTSDEALEYIEMVLKGKLNGHLVSLINAKGKKAVGLSGKDGNLIVAKKRYHLQKINGEFKTVDLGHVGEVAEVNVDLVNVLLKNDFMPVITCIAADELGNTYNINGDNFAGHLAGAIQSDTFILMTDVDGLLMDIEDPDSIIRQIKLDEVKKLIDQGIIKGGMIPKLEACKTALATGANSARIINGTKPQMLLNIFNGKSEGTEIIK